MASEVSNTPPSFFSNILTPGSSLHPTFLLALDVAFGLLLLVFIGLAILTKGNPHILALICIEGCLWASVKWFVLELQKIPSAGVSPRAVSLDKSSKDE